MVLPILLWGGIALTTTLASYFLGKSSTDTQVINVQEGGQVIATPPITQQLNSYLPFALLIGAFLIIKK